MAARNSRAWAVGAATLLLAVGVTAGLYRAAAVRGAPDTGRDAAGEGAERHPGGSPGGDGKKLDNRPATLTNREVQALLRKPLALDKPFEAGFLKELLVALTDKYNVPIRVDAAAFARMFHIDGFGVYDVQVKLPLTKGLSVGDALRDALAQVSVQEWNMAPCPRLSYKVRDGQILIVPGHYPQPADPAESTLQIDTKFAQDLGDPVWVTVEDKPLTLVLEDLRTTTGANIVLDNRQKVKAHQPVSADLSDVPLLTALHVLTDGCELRPVVMHNVYYITSPENAARIHKEYHMPLAGEPAPAPKNP